MLRSHRVVDADFEVVGGPYRVGDEHRSRKGWFFTGKYDPEGHPYFMRSPAWFRRRQALRTAAKAAAIGGLIAFATMVVAFQTGMIPMDQPNGPPHGSREAAIQEASNRGLLAH